MGVSGNWSAPQLIRLQVTFFAAQRDFATEQTLIPKLFFFFITLGLELSDPKVNES